MMVDVGEEVCSSAVLNLIVLASQQVVLHFLPGAAPICLLNSILSYLVFIHQQQTLSFVTFLWLLHERAESFECWQCLFHLPFMKGGFKTQVLFWRDVLKSHHNWTCRCQGDLHLKLWNQNRLPSNELCYPLFIGVCTDTCILPERFGKKDRLVRCIAKDVTSRHVTDTSGLYDYPFNLSLVNEN